MKNWIPTNSSKTFKSVSPIEREKCKIQISKVHNYLSNESWYKELLDNIKRYKIELSEWKEYNLNEKNYINKNMWAIQFHNGWVESHTELSTLSECIKKDSVEMGLTSITLFDDNRIPIKQYSIKDAKRILKLSQL